MRQLLVIGDTPIPNYKVNLKLLQDSCYPADKGNPHGRTKSISRLRIFSAITEKYRIMNRNEFIICECPHGFIARCRLSPVSEDFKNSSDYRLFLSLSEFKRIESMNQPRVVTVVAPASDLIIYLAFLVRVHFTICKLQNSKNRDSKKRKIYGT